MIANDIYGSTAKRNSIALPQQPGMESDKATYSRLLPVIHYNFQMIISNVEHP